MAIQKACYSISKLYKAADMVKACKWTVNRKNEHFAKYMEIEKIFSYCAENLNRFCFDPDFELKEYRQAAYKYKDYTKKELDKMLHLIHRRIGNELNGILQMISSGEVDSCD